MMCNHSVFLEATDIGLESLKKTIENVSKICKTTFILN
jgi:hypothetical protein